MDDVDDALRLVAVLIIVSTPTSAVVSALLFDVVSQVLVLDELLKVGFEGLAIFDFVPILLVVTT